ncbi:Dihydropteroate synthase [Desulfocicer vacuolatum DSM 3385]|uniref:Dihydropteroate synthase n=1 Tax=Desulfocicer vacuolatum DSM 3385 TaxID=1121400 RepID=A0A1W2DZT7_9BACT|nr:dihydropteroate synthase [Desulfocicer vacuolatum]SMD02632.1 Dihydropteroate synthase [Desulfocicer vacuolatum DSM 3385]
MKSFTIEWDGYCLDLSPGNTCIMGILNTTPDSFSDGGKFFSFDDALAQGRALVDAGAGILDIGGESTRPFSKGVSVQEEMDRVVPVIERLSREIDVPISIDTVKADVAKEALKAGAAIINDITALERDPGMAVLAAAEKVPVMLMHMKGTPETMQVDPQYDDFMGEITAYLEQRIQFAVESGISREHLIVDPGIGFGKTVDHNLMLIKHLDQIHSLGCPVLMGPSRKSFIRNLLSRKLNKTEVDMNRMELGNLGAVAACILNGAQIVRVHDVNLLRPLACIINAIQTV